MSRHVPVMYDDLSDIKNDTACAISSTSPIRPIGIFLHTSSSEHLKEN